MVLTVASSPSLSSPSSSLSSANVSRWTLAEGSKREYSGRISESRICVELPGHEISEERPFFRASETWSGDELYKVRSSGTLEIECSKEALEMEGSKRVSEV